MHPFASLARAVFLKGFLLMEITHRGLSRPRYRPPTPVMDESEVKVKSESESEKSPCMMRMIVVVITKRKAPTLLSDSLKVRMKVFTYLKSSLRKSTSWSILAS